MDLSLLRGHGQPHLPESRVTLWQVVRNPAATPVRVTTKYHDMTSRNNRFSCRIGHEADKHRSQSSVWNQAEIESILLLQQTLPSKYKRNSMLRILLTVALNDLPPVQRQDPEGKNTNGLGKSILE